MRILVYASCVVVATFGLGLNAQIRTPIATEPLTTTQPGPAPYNAKAVATSPTSAAVSWDAVSGARGYTVDRSRTDDATCCAAHSGLITTPSWNDGALEAGKEYSFVITALYLDGRVGATEVVVATPMPALPSVRLPRGAELSSAEGVLRLTPCGQKSSGGPGPAAITPYIGSPAGARFSWVPVYGSGMNYVVDRAPEGTTTWTLVGSTCGGPSPIVVASDNVFIQDFAGGVTVGGKYVYRILAVSANGAVGWNTYHFMAPCRNAPVPQVTVTGSTVVLRWSADNITPCSPDPVAEPDTYTLSTSFGFTKTKKAHYWNSETLYGVPLGTHTVTMVGSYRTGGSTPPATATITIQY